jgi:nucleoid DNA-binding protein
MYMDAKKLMNQKNYIMKHNKITEKEIEEIKKELQANRRSHLEEREEEELEYPGTIRDREQRPITAFTTEEETEIHQQRDQTHKLKEKIESTYYQVTQIAIDNRPRLQKLQNMSKIKVIMKKANEAMEETLDEKNLNITV